MLNFIRPKSASLWAMSLVLPAAHLLLTVATRLDVMHTEGSWGWFLVFLVDLPVSLLFVRVSILDPLLVFGIGGTAWWFVINRLIVLGAQELLHAIHTSPSHR
jgi:hypothetical protein